MEIIEAQWVLPVEPWTVIENGAVAVEDGRIADVGPAAEVRARNPHATARTLGAVALLPGLVNAHTHAAMTLLRGYADDVPLMSWLNDRIWPAESRWVDPGFVTDGTLLAAAEMLTGGVTTFADMYFFPSAAIEACGQAGIRVMSGQVIVEGATAYGAGPDDYLHKAQEVVAAYRDVPLVHFSVAPHAPYTVSDATLARAVELADQWDVPLNIHVHETRDEIEQSLAQHGERPLARMDRLGAVSDRLLAAHAVHLTDDEIALLAQRGSALVHCPASNLKLASGMARFADWLSAGIRVGVGTDGPASNNRLDLLSDLRLASLLAKAVSNDAAVVPARQALHTATLGGAQALGLADRIGSLTVDKEADMIAVDLGAWQSQPLYDVASHLVYATAPGAVREVWVAGRLRVSDGSLVDLDPAALAATARQWGSRIAG